MPEICRYNAIDQYFFKMPSMLFYRSILTLIMHLKKFIYIRWISVNKLMRKPFRSIVMFIAYTL